MEKNKNLSLILVGNNPLEKSIYSKLKQNSVHNIYKQNFQALDYPRNKAQNITNEFKINKKIKLKNNNEEIYILCAANGQTTELAKLNKYLIQNNKTFFPILVHYNFALAGPIIIPKKSACFDCVLQRLALNILNFDKLTNASHETEEQVYNNMHNEPVIISLISSIISMFFCKKIPTNYKNSLNKIIEFNFQTLEVCHNHILRFPLCASCKL